jgi:hypothetical protein
MSSREVAAAAAVALMGALGFAVGLVASSDLASAFLLGLAAASVAALAGVLLLLQRLRRSLHRQELQDHERLEVDRKRLTQARELAREQRRAADASRKLAMRVRRLEGSSSKVLDRLTPLVGSVAALQRDVSVLRTPPRPLPVTGSDLTSPGARVMAELEFDGAEPSVVLLLQSFGSRVMFAGIRTAALAAVELAGRLELPLRVIVFEDLPDDPQASVATFAELIRGESDYPHLAETLRLSAPNARDHRGHHADDVWVATFWTTAWNVARLVAEKRVRADKVVYVVQDWEPGFYPWGDLQQKALSTYEAGFQLLVNSRSLARYVEDRTGRPVDPARVFAPELDPAPLRAAAARWMPSPERAVRVLFYARPSKPRNMLNLGLQALRTWSLTLPDDSDVVVRLAGEPMGEVDLGPRLRAEVLGKLSYDAYYDLLADTDVGLALMSSPHPGHLALELPMAGIPTVTNPFEGYREAWVHRLLVAERADAEAIAAALTRAVATASSLRAHEPVAEIPDLGLFLREAVAATAIQVGA